MKKLLLPLLASGLGLAASAQTNTPVAAQGPTVSAAAAATAAAPTATDRPVEPTSTTTPDNTRYLNDPKLLQDCEVRLAAFNDKPCDLIFIGASNIAGWAKAGKAVWNQLYVPRHALNFGVEGDKTQNVLWRLNNMEIQNLKPKVAVIQVGSNNIANTSHEIADGVQAVIANTQEAFPGVKIILVSVIPSERANDIMMQANSIIKNSADDSTIYYLDLVPLMPSVTITNADGSIDSTWKGLGKDHLHLDAEGYKIWADAMEPLLTKLMGPAK